jgi:hypothetical protein
MVKAMKGWDSALEPFTEQPKGMFGRKAEVRTGNVTLVIDEQDYEFECPFDDDTEANEIEIKAYNLSDTTISGLVKNNPISIEAGYTNDTGVIFSGFISDVRTKYEGVNKVTTIKAIDDADLMERDIEERTYAAGVLASYILFDLIRLLGLPLGAFMPKRDWVYKDEQKVSNGLMDNIRKYAQVCGISVYINKGQLYARHLTDGDNINFVLSEETGLIGRPEEFEEEVTAEDYKDIIKGYKLKMVFQHRMTTAAIINIDSRELKGQFRVRGGRHVMNESENITEIEVI